MEPLDTYATLLLSRDGAVATVALNRPAAMHAINGQMLDDLAEAFRDLAADPAVRAILLTGEGDKAFAGGADIRELAEVGRLAGEQLSRRAQLIFNLIANCPKPVIACIQGYALGGGCELALACTLRIAADNAKLAQPEIKLGLLPGFGGTQRLPRLVGPSAALKLMLTGEMIGAAEALRMGLVDEVVPAAQLMTRGRQLAASIAAMPPLAVVACLDAVRLGSAQPLERGLDLEAQLFGHLCGTADKHEGTYAFLEKRTPVWTGQ